ncbi:uncharacterized protein [Arachis hypogaea]|uniref:uncharacterized protein isoform X2 n=1 Tax=Arachis hypogaea TaxID=3818 RepID=UPI0010FC622E|nr:uncharacterized protein LOC112795714 isoform X2 [Arachis hypogaea]
MALLLAPHPHTALLRHAMPPPRLCYTAPPPQLCYFATTPQLSYVAPPPRRALLLCSASPLLIVPPLLRQSLLDSLSHRRQGEQLKKGSVVTDKSSLPLSDTTNTNQMDNMDKRPGMLRSPKYTNKRVDEVFPARKSKFGVVSGKENAKVILFAKLMILIQENPSLEKTTTNNLKNVLVFSTSAAKRQQGSSCMENSATSGQSIKRSGCTKAMCPNWFSC